VPHIYQNSELCTIGVQYQCVANVTFNFAEWVQSQDGWSHGASQLQQVDFSFDQLYNGGSFPVPSQFVYTDPNQGIDIESEYDSFATAVANGVLSAYVAALEGYQYGGNSVFSSVSAALLEITRDSVVESLNTVYPS
jgi:hypothetical protein